MKRLDLTEKEAKLLIYVVNNALENIWAREEIDKQDKKAIEFIDAIKKKISAQ